MHEDFRNYVEELLANQPCPIDTWIHLRNCPKCSQELAALRRLSCLLPRGPEEPPEQDPLFYARVQSRIAHLRRRSPWRVFLGTSFAKRLVLTCLACTGLLAVYLYRVSSEEYAAQSAFSRTDFASPETADRQTQRDAVLVNFAMDSASENR